MAASTKHGYEPQFRKARNTSRNAAPPNTYVHARAASPCWSASQVFPFALDGPATLTLAPHLRQRNLSAGLFGVAKRAIEVSNVNADTVVSNLIWHPENGYASRENVHELSYALQLHDEAYGSLKDIFRMEAFCSSPLVAITPPFPPRAQPCHLPCRRRSDGLSHARCLAGSAAMP